MDEFTAIINRQDLSARERYLMNDEAVNWRDRMVATIFNGLSRSRANFKFMMLRSEGLADEAQLAQLSKIVSMIASEIFKAAVSQVCRIIVVTLCSRVALS